MNFGRKIEQKEFEILAKRYREIQGEIYKKHVTLFPGLLETFKDLKKRGTRLAVLTNRPLPSLELLVDYLEVREFFEVFFLIKKYILSSVKHIFICIF